MGRLIVAEFQKLFASKLWLVLLIGSVAISVLYASLAIAFADNPGNPTPPLSTKEGQGTVFATAQGASTLVAVLGAIGLTGEFRHKTATATFLATPKRGRVVLAKLIAYCLTGIAYAIVCLAAVTAVAVPWLNAKGVTVVMEGKPAIFIGVVASIAIFAAVGVGLGALLRDQVATVVGLLVYLFIVEPILTRVPALESWTKYLPGAAEDALTQVTQSNQHLLAPIAGGVVLFAYGVVFAVAGSFLAVRRDVT